MTTEETSPQDPPAELDDAQKERLSRFLALVLRHRAPQFDLEMNDEGFVHIDDLLDVIDERQRSLDWVEPEHIEALTQTEDGARQRFEMRGDLVRATYGHSFHRPIKYPSVEPPEKLYFGLAKSKLPEVRMSGLKPQGRQYLHLSEDEGEAMEVGLHQNTDVSVITIKAREAAANGIHFYKPTTGLFLTSHIPPDHMELELMFGRAGRKARRRR